MSIPVPVFHLQVLTSRQKYLTWMVGWLLCNCGTLLVRKGGCMCSPKKESWHCFPISGSTRFRKVWNIGFICWWVSVKFEEPVYHHESNIWHNLEFYNCACPFSACTAVSVTDAFEGIGNPSQWFHRLSFLFSTFGLLLNAVCHWVTLPFRRFRSIAKSYFRRADGVLLLYDCTYERSFLNVRDWIQSIEVSKIVKRKRSHNVPKSQISVTERG